MALISRFFTVYLGIQFNSKVMEGSAGKGDLSNMNLRFKMCENVLIKRLHFLFPLFFFNFKGIPI